MPAIVLDFLDRLRRRLGEVDDRLVPSSLFDSFKYTQTGKNFSHPRVWGLATRAAWDVVPDAGIVEVDPRLSRFKQKFQPDLLIRDQDERECLAVDIESPNSSDARLVPKDLDAYLNWIGRRGGTAFPYLVITMLPDRSVTTDEWDFRWVRGYNRAHAADGDAIRENPYAYWFGVLANQAALIEGHPLFFANFDGADLNLVDLASVQTRLIERPEWIDEVGAGEIAVLVGCEEGGVPGSAIRLVESVAEKLGEEATGSLWPNAEQPASAWARLRWKGKDTEYWLGVGWDSQEHRVSIGVWTTKGWCWPSCRGPAWAGDLQGFRDRVRRLDAWWNGS